jgi:glycosyltransferase involved in cell wall biosynthesis
MRIGIFTNTYRPTVNGVAKCVEYYERGLRQRGHEVVIFAPAPEEYDRAQDPPFVYRFPALPIPLELDYSIAAPYSRGVVRALRRLDFDIIHTQHPIWVGAWGAWYARWAEVPLVTTVHTEYRLFAHLMPLPEPLVEAYLRMRVSSYCNKCELITTPVPSMRRLLRREGVRRPIEILPNPTDVEAFLGASGEEVRRTYGIPQEALLLGFVGRLSIEKNLSFLLQAAARVMHTHAEVYFLLVGDGSERADLEAQARREGLADRVIFSGAMPHARIPGFQAAFDLFVTASLSETQPLAYTEAMASGKPVVALTAPGAQDMILPGKNGLLAEAEGGPEALAEQIAVLVEDRARRQEMGTFAREWVQQFDVARVAERLEAIYHRARAHALEEPI